jgi:uncharacterized protein (TIGR03382 family)
VLALAPSTAFAQQIPPVLAGNDVDVAQAEVDHDYAQALAADCGTACRALESMRRATERLCALDPGDRCARAKHALDDAGAHVKSACPECAEALERRNALAPADAPASMSAVQSESVQGKRGCAGCATASRPVDAAVPLTIAGLVLLSLRRRRRG